MSTTAAAHAAKIAPPVSLDRVSFGYAGGPLLFDAFSLSFGQGITAVLGSSGAGKSSMLRLIAGRLAPTGGQVQGTDERHIAWMGQAGGLLPWSSAAANMSLGARLRGETPDEARLGRLLDHLGLSAHGTKRPAELSGGMQQRVALGRALMEDAAIILLDEPFAHLDARTKAQLTHLAVREMAGRIVVMVTHDPLDALTIADRIVVLAGSPAIAAVDEVLPSPAPRDPRDAMLDNIYRRILTALDVP